MTQQPVSTSRLGARILSQHGSILFAGCVLVCLGLMLPSTAYTASPSAASPSAVSPSAAAQTNGGDTNNGNTNPQARFLPSPPAIATADSNGSMIAVTGIDLSGASILYLVDTNARQLAIYQASGGSDSMQGVKLVGARKIDLDLQLEGFNDKSQYSYEELEKRFQDNLRATKPAPKKP